MAYVEMNHVIPASFCPRPSLRLFILGVFENFISPESHRDQIWLHMGGDVDGNKESVSQLMQHVQQAHEQWISRIEQSSGTYLMQFGPDRTARLVDLLQIEAPQDQSSLFNRQEGF
jgi:hypothetical protein